MLHGGVLSLEEIEDILGGPSQVAKEDHARRRSSGVGAKSVFSRTLSDPTPQPNTSNNSNSAGMGEHTSTTKQTWSAHLTRRPSTEHHTGANRLLDGHAVHSLLPGVHNALPPSLTPEAGAEMPRSPISDELCGAPPRRPSSLSEPPAPSGQTLSAGTTKAEGRSRVAAEHLDHGAIAEAASASPGSTASSTSTAPSASATSGRHHGDAIRRPATAAIGATSRRSSTHATLRPITAKNRSLHVPGAAALEVGPVNSTPSKQHRQSLSAQTLDRFELETEDHRSERTRSKSLIHREGKAFDAEAFNESESKADSKLAEALAHAMDHGASPAMSRNSSQGSSMNLAASSAMGRNSSQGSSINLAASSHACEPAAMAKGMSVDDSVAGLSSVSAQQQLLDDHDDDDEFNRASSHETGVRRIMVRRNMKNRRGSVIAVGLWGAASAPDSEDGKEEKEEGGLQAVLDGRALSIQLPPPPPPPPHSSLIKTPTSPRTTSPKTPGTSIGSGHKRILSAVVDAKRLQEEGISGWGTVDEAGGDFSIPMMAKIEEPAASNESSCASAKTHRRRSSSGSSSSRRREPHSSGTKDSAAVDGNLTSTGSTKSPGLTTGRTRKSSATNSPQQSPESTPQPTPVTMSQRPSPLPSPFPSPSATPKSTSPAVSRHNSFDLSPSGSRDNSFGRAKLQPSSWRLDASPSPNGSADGSEKLLRSIDGSGRFNASGSFDVTTGRRQIPSSVVRLSPKVSPTASPIHGTSAAEGHVPEMPRSSIAGKPPRPIKANRRMSCFVGGDSSAAAAQLMRSTVGFSPLRTSSADTGQFQEAIVEEPPFTRCSSSEADEKEGSKRSWIGKNADDAADVFGEMKLEKQQMMAEYGRTGGRGGRRGSMPVVSSLFKDDDKEEEMKETMLRLKALQLIRDERLAKEQQQQHVVQSTSTAGALNVVAVHVPKRRHIIYEKPEIKRHVTRRRSSVVAAELPAPHHVAIPDPEPAVQPAMPATPAPKEVPSMPCPAPTLPLTGVDEDEEEEEEEEEEEVPAVVEEPDFCMWKPDLLPMEDIIAFVAANITRRFHITVTPPIQMLSEPSNLRHIDRWRQCKGNNKVLKFVAQLDLADSTKPAVVYLIDKPPPELEATLEDKAGDPKSAMRLRVKSLWERLRRHVRSRATIKQFAKPAGPSDVKKTKWIFRTIYFQNTDSLGVRKLSDIFVL